MRCWPDGATGQTGSFLNMAPEVVLGERYNEMAVCCVLHSVGSTHPGGLAIALRFCGSCTL
jgi:hypothetical protein